MSSSYQPFRAHQSCYLDENIKLDFASKEHMIYLQSCCSTSCILLGIRTRLVLSFYILLCSLTETFSSDMRSILGTSQGRLGQKLGHESRGVLPRWITGIPPFISSVKGYLFRIRLQKQTIQDILSWGLQIFYQLGCRIYRGNRGVFL